MKTKALGLFGLLISVSPPRAASNHLKRMKALLRTAASH